MPDKRIIKGRPSGVGLDRLINAYNQERGYRTSQHCDDYARLVQMLRVKLISWESQAVSIPGFLASSQFDSHPAAAAD